MELIVAEKPKVAEKIAHAISDKVEKKVHGGISYYELERDGEEIFVAPAVGHVFTLVEKQKGSGYPSFDIEWVPAYKANPKIAAYTKPYIELLQKLGRKADHFVSACDYDVEGSTIAYNVFRFATTIKEGSRMKFSALTKSDLAEAYEKRGDFDYNNAYAGETRHILDWYYGINLSRALMSSLRAASRYRVLSIGRVQGPALEVLATLEKEIRAFVPTPYWEISAKINEIEFMHKNGRFDHEPDADSAYEKTNGKAEIKSVEKKEQDVPTPSNFDLTSLQMEAYRLFKYSPSRVMEIAQNLYEASVITYPRTSSQKIPDSINVKAILADLGKTTDYSSLVKKLTQNKWFTPVQGKKEDPAHPAIHPTGLHSSAAGPEKNLYDLIVRRFLSSFAPKATRERMRVEADSNGQLYAASGSRLKDKGWVEFYGDYYTQEDTELPPFKVGEKHSLNDKKKERKETKPPKRYTQASIVSELEDRHLGTKSTRSVIVDTLVKRGYAQGTSSLEISDFGIKVCDVLMKYAPEILDENLTRKIEDEMEGIQEGKVNKDEVVKEGKEILIQILDKWKKNEAKIGTDLLDALKNTEDKERLVGTCDKCGKQLRIIRMRFGKQFIGCSGYPDCRNAYPLPGGAFVKVTEKLCATCNKPTVFVKRAKARPFTMCIDPKCPTKASWGKKPEKNETEKTGKTKGGEQTEDSKQKTEAGETAGTVGVADPTSDSDEENP
ncbi:DNA topoisomerase I [Candidatus Micrarchaeota archaeon]|nr:DNA topoisomerase I [Candidatus Micrarchaeota archaeon]